MIDKHIGSNFDDFLKEERIEFDETLLQYSNALDDLLENNLGLRKALSDIKEIADTDCYNCKNMKVECFDCVKDRLNKIFEKCEVLDV